jgi:hypothetical protein
MKKLLLLILLLATAAQAEPYKFTFRKRLLSLKTGKDRWLNKSDDARGRRMGLV